LALLHPLKFYALFLMFCKEGVTTQVEAGLSSRVGSSFNVKKGGSSMVTLGSYIQENGESFRELNGRHSSVFSALAKKKEKFIAFLNEFKVSPSQFQSIFQVP